MKENQEIQTMPQVVDLEKIVLGAIMLETGAISVVADMLKPATFYYPPHQRIYSAQIQLFEQGTPVDLMTVQEQMKKNGDLDNIGGVPALVELTNRVASSANLEYHARIILQKSMRRDLIVAAQETIKAAYSDEVDALELLDEAEQKIFSIAMPRMVSGVSTIGSILSGAVKGMEKAASSEGLIGVPSGFTDLDRITNGWQEPNLTILAGRPGMGKTAMSLALARNAAVDFGKPVAFFSMEMSKKQLTQRLIYAEAEVNSKNILSGNATAEEWERVQSAAVKLSRAPIFIDDTPGVTPMQLRSRCRRLKLQHDIQLIIVDYLQLINPGRNFNRKSTNDAVSNISRNLKLIAKELKVPVICLSQLSRAVEQRGGSKRPLLSDLRDSGSIEQDADQVIFLYRPEYYSILEDEEGQSLKGICEAIVAKHRDGALGTVKLRFVARIAKFQNLETYFDESLLFEPESKFPELANGHMADTEGVGF